MEILVTIKFKSREHSFLHQLAQNTDYGRPERKQSSLHGRKFTPTPKFLGMAAAYFVCHIGPFFQVSQIHAFIGCPQSLCIPMSSESFNNYLLNCQHQFDYGVLDLAHHNYILRKNQPDPREFHFLNRHSTERTKIGHNFRK